ncbi:glycerophosphodiester phosphodiesterase [Paeniglutamicibacter cryotolerans]
MAGCVGGQVSTGKVPPVHGPTSTSGGLILIAHRGAWRVFPESSAEAFAAMAGTAYPIEFDLRRLSDGTLVPSHDATADRIMQGISGPLDRINPDQWRGASIRSQDGTSLGTPTTWDEILERYGGKTVLVPELKRPVTDLAGFIASILDRGIQDTVIVQSADYEVCQELAAAGLRTVLVIQGGQPVPTQIKADGIGHVAVSRDLPASYFKELKDAGLEIWVFLVNRAGPLQEYLDRGVAGVFTDDPWKLEEELAESGRTVAGGP